MDRQRDTGAPVRSGVAGREPSAPLGGLRVLDLSTGVAGQYCGKLLAAFGAECVLVEPPEGTATRRWGPSLEGSPADVRSTLFRHLNQGKTSLVVDPGAPVTGRALAARAATAHVVIHDRDRALPFPLDPTTIECAIAEFPDQGPYAAWRGNEMVHQALSGTMYMTGRPDREPLYGLGHRAYYACGTTACISVLSALHERRTSGLGQRVNTTVFESVAAIGQNFVSQYSYSKTYESRQRYPGFLALLECTDHWMVLFAIRNWEGLCSVFDLEELLDDERLATQSGRHHHWEEVTERLQERARTRTAAQLVDALQRQRISAEVVAPLHVLVGSPQWTARHLVRWAADGAGQREATLGPPFSIGDAPYAGVRPAPALDASDVSAASAAVRAGAWTSERWPIPRGGWPAVPVASSPTDTAAGRPPAPIAGHP